jgi:hypothetical protein
MLRLRFLYVIFLCELVECSVREVVGGDMSASIVFAGGSICESGMTIAWGVDARLFGVDILRGETGQFCKASSVSAGPWWSSRASERVWWLSWERNLGGEDMICSCFDLRMPPLFLVRAGGLLPRLPTVVGLAYAPSSTSCCDAAMSSVSGPGAPMG